MSTYQELNNLPARSFLEPENFKNGYDCLPEPGYAQAQYEKGLKISNESHSVGVSAYGTWWARGKDGSVTTSYEGIGYHSCTSDLLRGLLAGTAQFVVYRLTDNGFEETVLKES